MSGENPVPEEAMMGNEKVVDKRAATLEAQEKEKGMEVLKDTFGFTDEELGIVGDVFKSDTVAWICKEALKAKEKSGDKAGLNLKLGLLRWKLEAFDPALTNSFSGDNIHQSLGGDTLGSTTLEEAVRGDLKRSKREELSKK